jgi:hypothetical protein
MRHRAARVLTGFSPLYLLLIAATAAHGQSLFWKNLIVNGDAEAGPGSPSGFPDPPELYKPPGWTVTEELLAVQYAASSTNITVPAPGSPGPANRGRNFFDGGQDNAFSSAEQVIDFRPMRPSWIRERRSSS